MDKITSIPRKLTIELYYDAMDEKQHEYVQGLLLDYLNQWNHGKNKFLSEPVGDTSRTVYQL